MRWTNIRCSILTNLQFWLSQLHQFKKSSGHIKGILFFSILSNWCKRCKKLTKGLKNLSVIGVIRTSQIVNVLQTYPRFEILATRGATIINFFKAKFVTGHEPVKFNFPCSFLLLKQIFTSGIFFTQYWCPQEIKFWHKIFSELLILEDSYLPNFSFLSLL